MERAMMMMTRLVARCDDDDDDANGAATEVTQCDDDVNITSHDHASEHD